VIDDKGVFESMKKSGKLVIMHWKHTFLITVLMILIGIRIIIQAVLVFLIPAIVVLITGYIATITIPVTGVIIGGIAGFIALIVAAYLNGIVDIFSYTVWTHTFLEISSEKEVSAREVFKDDIGEHGDHNYSGHKNLS
jgi:Cu/Ag efflux pump CusA